MIQSKLGIGISIAIAHHAVERWTMYLAQLCAMSSMKMKFLLKSSIKIQLNSIYYWISVERDENRINSGQCPELRVLYLLKCYVNIYCIGMASVNSAELMLINCKSSRALKIATKTKRIWFTHSKYRAIMTHFLVHYERN